MDAPIYVVWIIATAVCYGIAWWQRRGFVWAALFFSSLAVALAMIVIAFRIDGPETRRLILGLSWGAFSAAGFAAALSGRRR